MTMALNFDVLGFRLGGLRIHLDLGDEPDAGAPAGAVPQKVRHGVVKKVSAAWLRGMIA